jgi:hypothetical protein
MIDSTLEGFDELRKLENNGISTDTMSMAVHEVGHAIVAREVGLTPTKLVIRQFWSGDGYCEIKEGQVYGDEGVRGVCQVYMAGIEAQHLWTTEMGLPAVVGTDAYDLASYEKLCDESELVYDQNEARSAAVAILANEVHWRELKELAMELAMQGRMSGSAL